MIRPLHAALLASCSLLGSSVARADGPSFAPGLAGAGDPYYPLDGNGGYDVEHYLLQVRYEPSTGLLSGVASISALATQDLSRFNLDLDGLSVSSVEVDAAAASWSLADGELSITPAQGLPTGTPFSIVIAYQGQPAALIDDGGLGPSGFVRTDDGALIIGEPHVASSWFPANDHPSDRATFSFEISVPEGVEVAANGALIEQRTLAGWTTWVWDATYPMATYLASVAIGQLAVNAYEQAGIAYWDAIDPSAFDQSGGPTTGTQLLLSGQADLSYKRLSRTLSVPAEGAQLSFWVTRDTEPDWDFFFVEAHGVGADDWTTLPDLQGIASPGTGSSCPLWHAIHPFLAHYQTPPASENEACTPSGSTGQWWAASGASTGPEHWSIDLSAWAGTQVEVALSYASDDIAQRAGVSIDEIAVSTGEGNTSFEPDDDVLDGWTVSGPPPGSPGNATDWSVGTVADLPPSAGEIAQASLARQPEFIAFLAEQFGPYPFDVAGGIVDEVDINFALEAQTRPVYPAAAFTESSAADSLIVHELAHQWFGDSLTLGAWQHIWLNEGFATYAEWLWAEHEGGLTARAQFDAWYALDAESPFWSVVVADPGPAELFSSPVYVRGAMALQQLRVRVGDATFFSILQSWTDSRAGSTVTTDEFIALAEGLSGQSLEQLLQSWLFSAEKPSLAAPGATALAPSAPAAPVSPELGSAQAPSSPEAPQTAMGQ